MSRETEADYRKWHAGQAMPFLRATYAATILIVFPAAAAVTWFAVPDSFGQVAPWLLGLAPLFVAGIALTYRPWMLRWLGPTSIVYHAVGGCTFVLLGFEVMHRPDLAMAATVVSSFIGFSALRLHLAEAMLAVFPYFVIDEILMVRSGEDHGNVAAYTCVNLIAIVTGTIVAWTIDRTSRESYRQRRTIEAQQIVIDRERDRAAELRERELERVNEEVRRQVAERSREMSEALAKLSQPTIAIEADRTIDGRYRVVRRLGAGGMGAVYEVERAGDLRRLALKTLRGRANPDLMARLARPRPASRVDS